MVEYVVQNLFCDSCHKVEAKDTWVAVCQVRQHVNHKRTFLYLEQMILKYKAHTHCISYVFISFTARLFIFADKLVLKSKLMDWISSLAFRISASNF